MTGPNLSHVDPNLIAAEKRAEMVERIAQLERAARDAEARAEQAAVNARADVAQRDAVIAGLRAELAAATAKIDRIEGERDQIAEATTAGAVARRTLRIDAADATFALEIGPVPPGCLMTVRAAGHIPADRAQLAFRLLGFNALEAAPFDAQRHRWELVSEPVSSEQRDAGERAPRIPPRQKVG